MRHMKNRLVPALGDNFQTKLITEVNGMSCTIKFRRVSQCDACQQGSLTHFLARSLQNRLLIYDISEYSH